MQSVTEISKNIYYVGASDRRLERFENIHPLPLGVSYNSYLILDDKVALLDTVDQSVEPQFLENLDAALGGRPIDYLVLHHLEPDHGAAIETLCRKYPNLQIVATQKALEFLAQFHHFDTPPAQMAVKEGDELVLGEHTLHFYMAPMVHWPEVMFSYEPRLGILFSADAFGTFRALSGNVFSDEMDFEAEFLDEARRYYTNIVGKYGPQVQAALKKLADAPRMICPLHGPVWRKNIRYYLEKYNLWSTYTPEETGVLVVYGSMYGHTEQAANVMAGLLAKRGVRGIHMYDVSKTHHSYLIAETFKYSHLVLASPTYNMGLFLPMHTFVHDMGSLNMQNRKVAVIANGSWAPAAHTILQTMLGEMKNMELVAEPLLIRSSLQPQQAEQMEALADTIVASLKNHK